MSLRIAHVASSARCLHFLSLKTSRSIFTTSVCRVNVNQADGKIEVGDRAYITSKIITQEEAKKFCELTQNKDPIHFDEDKARTSCFGRLIVPWGMVYSLLAEVFAVYLPGPGAIILKYKYEHPNPLYSGEKMKTEIEVVEKRKRQVRIRCFATETTSGRIVAQGHSYLLLPKNRA